MEEAVEEQGYTNLRIKTEGGDTIHYLQGKDVFVSMQFASSEGRRQLSKNEGVGDEDC